MSADRETPEALFERHFLPLYPPDVRQNLAAARARDMNPAKNPSLWEPLRSAAEIFAHRGPTLVPGAGPFDFSDASVHRLSKGLSKSLRDAWARGGGAPGAADNELANIVIHGTAYVGECIVRRHQAEWSLRQPLWESVVVLESRLGVAHLSVFHWWLKALSDDALSGEGGLATLADRYRTYVEEPRRSSDEETPWVLGERSLPRLRRPRYSHLIKYLRAHLPELRDVGKDFPSPERFDELRFDWVDWVVLGQGRKVLMVGAAPKGLHLFWLGAGGFEKGAFLQREASFEPEVTLAGDILKVTLGDRQHPGPLEFPWWGP